MVVTGSRRNLLRRLAMEAPHGLPAQDQKSHSKVGWPPQGDRRDGEANSPLRYRKRGRVPGLRYLEAQASHPWVSEGRPRFAMSLLGGG